MGLFDRWRNAVGAAMAPPERGVGVRVLAGGEDLEVVGESAHQPALRAICGAAGRSPAESGAGGPGADAAVGACVRHEVVGVLVPEARGPGEPDAIAVQVDGAVVGHLPAGTAAEYLPGLRALMAQAGGHIALPGAIVGARGDGDALGRLDVWLDHDPRDFGVGTRGRVEPAAWPVAWGGTIRRAELTEPWAVDPLLADAGTPAWLAAVPDGEAGIPTLRRLLARPPAPTPSPSPDAPAAGSVGAVATSADGPAGPAPTPSPLPGAPAAGSAAQMAVSPDGPADPAPTSPDGPSDGPSASAAGGSGRAVARPGGGGALAGEGGGEPDGAGSGVGDPIGRHLVYVELEGRLYRLRPAGGVAPNAFEEACRRHDAEAEAICAAFRARWGTVPLLEAHRQMVIRQQRRRRWEACLWWAERGLALYGAAPGREAAVDDLRKRRHRALAELEAAAVTPTGATADA